MRVDHRRLLARTAGAAAPGADYGCGYRAASRVSHLRTADREAPRSPGRSNRITPAASSTAASLPPTLERMLAQIRGSARAVLSLREQPPGGCERALDTDAARSGALPATTSTPDCARSMAAMRIDPRRSAALRTDWDGIHDRLSRAAAGE